MNSKVMIKTDNDVLIFNLSDILFFKSREKKCIVYSKVNNDRITLNEQICKLEKRLTTKNFFRCHKSYMINLQHINKILDGKVIIINNSIEIPISRRKRHELETLLKSLTTN